MFKLALQPYLNDDSVRIASRYRLLLDVTANGDVMGDGLVLLHDVSVTGLLFETGAELPNGAQIDLQLPHIGHVVAEVVWHSGQFYGATLKAALSSTSVRLVVAESKVVFPRFGSAIPSSHDRKQTSTAVSTSTTWANPAQRGQGISIAHRAQIIIGLSTALWVVLLGGAFSILH